LVTKLTKEAPKLPSTMSFTASQQKRLSLKRLMIYSFSSTLFGILAQLSFDCQQLIEKSIAKKKRI
jgi:hypothetical protein